jgi:exodeoxyribonuclease-5
VRITPVGTSSAASSASAPQLNPEQAVALDALLQFIVDPDPSSPFFVLSGYAGTGKTFLMREVVARTSRSRLNFAFTAPTNKAAKVLRAITGKACTIYSLLGLRIEKNGELKELVGGEAPDDLSDIDVIVLDEASMVNKKLFALLLEEAKLNRLKIIFMGDIGQLPPVGEAVSPVWSVESKATLTKIMRYDNQILKLVTSVRDQIESFAPCINIKSDNAGGEGVWKLTKAAFKEAVYNAAANGEFADSSKAKVIAWRNVRVAEYNDLIRRAIFGGRSAVERYIVGDRVIATAPCKRGEDQLLATDDEAIVEDVITTTHPFHPEYTAYELKCRTELGKTIRLIVPHPLSEAKWEDDCQQLAFAAKSNGKMWKKFWELKDCFHEIKYGYAITAHRAQGSTYETVFVDYQDILLNRNRKEAFQCLYVATSRPTARLLLA